MGFKLLQSCQRVLAEFVLICVETLHLVEFMYILYNLLYELSLFIYNFYNYKLLECKPLGGVLAFQICLVRMRGYRTHWLPVRATKWRAIPKHHVLQQYEILIYRRVLTVVCISQARLDMSFVNACQQELHTFWKRFSFLSSTHIWLDNSSSTLVTLIFVDRKWINGEFIVKKSIFIPPLRTDCFVNMTVFKFITA